jgi:hypothetical protein
MVNKDIFAVLFCKNQRRAEADSATKAESHKETRRIPGEAWSLCAIVASPLACRDEPGHLSRA